jgi:hypothetical protein
MASDLQRLIVGGELMETLLGYLYSPFLALQQVPDKTIQVTVQNSGRVWYQNPIWIAIGILAVVMVLLLIVIAVRGSGGTTIVKD